jgi:hypothetical protein
MRFPELERAVQVSNRASPSLAVLGYAYGVFGLKDQALTILAELRERSTTAFVSPEDYALVYLGLRQDEQVLNELERAHQHHLSSLSILREGPEYDPLRANPRFADLLHRVFVN